MASSVFFSSQSMVQPSVYWRIGEEPMNVPTSSLRPVRWLISAIGVMSATVVRAAQLARTVSLRIDDLARQPLDVLHHVRAGAGQADVGGVDAELVDQVEDLDLLVDGRRAHRRRLQPVAQRLVVQHARVAGLAGAPILFQS